MNRVDPIRYAWAACNGAVPFPAELMRGASASNGVAGQPITEDELRSSTAMSAAADAVHAALQAFVVGDLHTVSAPSPVRSPDVETETPTADLTPEALA